MSSVRTIWYGTEAESRALLEAINRNCTCEYRATGAIARACMPHEAITRSQRFLDGLLFARRIAQRLVAEEWHTDARHQVELRSA